jgi:hypothetical protein
MRYSLAEVYATTTELIRQFSYVAICTATDQIRSITHEIIQQHLTDPQQEHIQALNSQYLPKCTDSVTAQVRSVMLISRDPKA